MSVSEVVYFSEEEYYCEECKTLCGIYEQGLSCQCAQPWETEVIYEKDYPKKWIKITVIGYK